MQIQPYTNGITPAGFVSKMPDTVYHATPGFISSTGLSKINRSPAHYKFQNTFKRTRTMEIGSALHSAILEPSVFEREYMVLEGVQARTESAYKQAIKARPAETTLTEKEGDELKMMQESIYGNPEASQLIAEAQHTELSLFVKHPVYGFGVRVRYDVFGGGTNSGYLADVKTSQDIRADEFAKSIFNYRYHCQAALYLDAYEWATGERLAGFKFLAIENDMPYSSKVYTLDDMSITIGRAIYERDMETYARCLESDTWPHPGADETGSLIALPEWAIMRFEAENETDTINVGE